MKASTSVSDTGKLSKRDELFLVRQCKRNDAVAQASFEKLMLVHKTLILGILRKMLKADVEDTYQEVVLHLWKDKRISRWRGDCALSTWLYRITVNIGLLEYWRRRGVSRTTHRPSTSSASLVSLEEQLVEGEPNRTLHNVLCREDLIQRSAPARADLEKMLKVMEKEAPGYHLAFVLHHIEGYEYHEIAEMLGCSVGNAKSQAAKARQKAKDIMLNVPRNPPGRPKMVQEARHAS